MAKVYVARHQAIGFLTQFPFANYPSAEQLAALEKLCFQAVGGTHPKTKETYWLNVSEFEVLTSEVPVVPQRSLSVAGQEVTQFEVAAVGTVTPPKGK